MVNSTEKAFSNRWREGAQEILDQEKPVEMPEGFDEEQINTNPTKEEYQKRAIDAGKFIAEMTPIVGDAMAAKEVYDEIQKEDTNWLYVGALGGAAVIGLIPGLGDAAAKLIKKGAEKTLDIGRRIEVDPNALGSTGGNIKLKPNNKNLTKDADTDAVDDLGLSSEDLELWKSKNYKKDKWRVPQQEDLALAAKALREGELTPSEYRELSDVFSPITPIKEMPKFPTKIEVAQALHATDKRKTKKGIVGVNKTIEDGTLVSSRLDIPAYNSSDTWVVTLHDGTVDRGDTIAYSQTAVLNDVKFTSDALAASKIATGSAKSTIARANGTWENMPPEEVYELASKLLNDEEWIQVGMNPYRSSYFYDKADGMPVVSAEKVIQVGPLVLAKKAKKTTPDDDQFKFFNKISGVTTSFATGGLISEKHARKGITTPEGIMMADKKDQLDMNEADTDLDGEVTMKERMIGERVQPMNLVGLSKGGLMLDDEERQQYYESHNITGSTTIREGSNNKRYIPVSGGGFEEDPNGSVVMITDSDGDVLYKFIDAIVSPGGAIKSSPIPPSRPDYSEKPEYGNEFDVQDGEYPYGNEFDVQKDYEDEFQYGDEFDTPPKNDDMPDPPADWKNEKENEFDDQEEKSIWENIKEKLGLNHGGLMSSDTPCGCGMTDCGCGMTEMMGITVGIDSETGNDIPAGSNADNVKDDIPAALSSGEFVLPADVVRWHGLDRIQGMVDDAKLGLMAMHSEGMIHDIAEEERSDSEKSEADKVSDEDSSPKKGKESSVQEERKTPEGNIIEIAEVIVDEDDSKKKKKKDSFAYNNTPKLVS